MEERCIHGTGTWWLNLRERAHLEDITVDGRVILKCIDNTMTGCGLM